MKKIINVLLVILFLFGCSKQTIKDDKVEVLTNFIQLLNENQPEKAKEYTNLSSLELSHKSVFDKKLNFSLYAKLASDLKFNVVENTKDFVVIECEMVDAHLLIRDLENRYQNNPSLNIEQEIQQMMATYPRKFFKQKMAFQYDQEKWIINFEDEETSNFLLRYSYGD